MLIDMDTRREQHIIADVALVQWQYYLATGDRAWADDGRPCELDIPLRPYTGPLRQRGCQVTDDRWPIRRLMGRFLDGPASRQPSGLCARGRTAGAK